MEYIKKIEYATRISTLLRDATYPIVLECVYSKDYNDVYFIQLLRVQMAGNRIVVFGTELNNNFVQDVDNTFHGVKQINKFKLEIVLSQTDADYIDIDSKLIGKENTFSCNTFARSKYGDVFMSLNDITHKAKVLVNSIENFTK
jgi:hypothetical protein